MYCRFCAGVGLGAYAAKLESPNPREHRLLNPPALTPAERDHLRPEWLDRAAASFDARFAPDQQPQLVTVTPRQDRAGQLGDHLATGLVQEQAAADPPARLPQDPPPAGPQGGRPGPRRTEPAEPVPNRRRTTRVGEVSLPGAPGRPVGSLVFPLDHTLALGTEGYSPRVVPRAVRPAAKAPSFREASADLREGADLAIRPTHLQRLSARIGTEGAARRDADGAAFQAGDLPRDDPEPPAGAAVMLDGGQVPTRGEDEGRGVQDPAWKETQVAGGLSLSAAEHAAERPPEPLAKFLDPARMARRAAELKTQGRPTAGRPEKPAARVSGGRPKGTSRRRRVRVRSARATPAASEACGGRMAAAVQRRGLDRATRPAGVGDGPKSTGTLFEWHLLPAGFVPVLDVLHLLVDLSAAAHAVAPKASRAVWELSERWLRWAWAGAVGERLQGLRAGARKLGPVPAGAGEDDSQRVVADAVSSGTNHRERMADPWSRRSSR